LHFGIYGQSALRKDLHIGERFAYNERQRTSANPVVGCFTLSRAIFDPMSCSVIHQCWLSITGIHWRSLSFVWS